MRQEILAGALKPIHKQAGLSLSEPKHGLLALNNAHCKAVAYFPSKTATITEIQAKADEWMRFTDSASYIVDPAVKFVQADHPFYDKKLTMQDFVEFICGRKANA
jgi:hypothetical protein